MTATLDAAVAAAPMEIEPEHPRPYLSYHLPTGFAESYAAKPVRWGFPTPGGASVGEITYYRTYSRIKPDGSKERWWETCARVIEGMISIQKDHCTSHGLPWTDEHADELATEAYDRMFEMKWLPPGRGLWMMGTEFVNGRRDATALQNCAFVSTAGLTLETVTEPFEFLLLASMHGVGVGFDVLGAAEQLVVRAPSRSGRVVLIEDSREGWASSTAAVIRAHFDPEALLDDFDYSGIRPAGTPIKGFGGTAGGPELLRELHQQLQVVLGRYALREKTMDSRLITDLCNLIGKAVVAGNVRRSAEIALGLAEDEEFVGLKDFSRPENTQRTGIGGWSWVSNNSVIVKAGADYRELARQTALAGEPGFFWLENARRYGRMGDAPNDRDQLVAGVNPCGEQSLESYEMCTLVEVFPTRCASKEDFLRTLKFSYMYGKTVTLLPTVFRHSNAIMARNRRIGCSVSGLAGFIETKSRAELRTWLDEGYHEVQRWDREYSRWLGVRESIKTTSVKPSGSVSLLAGVTPGVHYPPAGTMLRAIRIGKHEPLVKALETAGYRVEPALENPETTVVVYLPCRGVIERTEADVPLWEKAELAAIAQEVWADNQVSATLTFNPAEADQIASVLAVFDTRLKGVSFLPLSKDAYPQMPYTSITEEEYARLGEHLADVEWDGLYSGGGQEAVGEVYCTTDHCELPQRS